jgi:hypothetical protein
MVFVAYIAVLAFYYALKVDVPIAVFIGLILEASVSIARTLKMEQRSRQQERILLALVKRARATDAER